MKLSYQDCVRICDANDSFKHKVDEVDGYKVHQFDYFLAQYSDFADPLGDGSLDAFEIRGLTFIEIDGDFQRFIVLHKFFNLNQTTGCMLEDVQDKKVVRVQDKADGSVIRFLRLPNGRVIAKSRFSLQSEQAAAAQTIYEKDPDIHKFVDYTLDTSIAAVFEIVAPWNQVVLYHNETHLILLQMREEETGKYLPFDPALIQNQWNIRVTEDFELTSIEELEARCRVLEDVEGFVIQLDDGQMLKIKTEWYRHRHRLLTENCNREDYVIETTLAGMIDDILADIPQGNSAVRDFITEIAGLVVPYVNQQADRVLKVMEEDYKGDRKAFVMTHKQDPLFNVMMRMVDRGIDIETAETFVKERVLKECNALEKARVWLRKHFAWERKLGVPEAFTESSN